MEFTETAELFRVFKDVRRPSKNPYIKDASASPEAIEKMLEYADNIEDCLNYSPPSQMITQLPESFRVPSIDQIIMAEHQSKEEVDKKPVRRTTSSGMDAGVQMKKDERYLETYEQSLRQVSTLTQSLLRDDTLPCDLDSGFITLTVYLFATTDLLQVAVQRTITIEQCIQKTVSAYVRSQFQKTRPLRFPNHAEAYTLWLVEDDSQLPDKDFAVEKTMKIGDLGAEALAFCEVDDFKAKDDIKGPGISQLQEISEITQAVALKICFEDNWTVVAVSPELKLRDVLTLLERKFPEAGYFSPEEFEFKVGVQIDTQIRHAEECVLDMDLQVCSLTIKELKLNRKTYADSPSLIVTEKIRKEETPMIMEEEVKYDPQRLYMTKAQACAYQEYEVIKMNRRGKRQKRVLGIDQHRLYNMTESQAREAAKLASTGHSSARKIIRNKIEGLFKSMTHHPEIMISNLQGIKQHEKNLKAFVLEYVEEGVNKKKLYELGDSSQAAEVVAKITKLMALETSEA